MYDSHMDTPSQLLRLRDPGLDNAYAQVDFPKLRRGGVDGAFFALYTPAEMAPDAATRYALQMLSATYDAVEAHPGEVSLAISPQDVVKARKNGLISIFLGMENASPIQESLALLRTFYRMGVRYLTLTHNGDNAVADSVAEGKRWGGLSPFGREVVAEMNRLGMMVDLSHAADSTFWDCIKLSRAPIVATHSCCRALCGHRRNLTDEMLQALGESDGYVGINFYPAFLSDDFGKDPADAALLDEADAVETAFNRNPADPSLAEAWHRMQDRLKELPRPGVKEIVDHVDHAVRLAGIDHVGLGSDYDGILVAPKGMDDVSRIGCVAREMARRGYSSKDIEKVTGKNLMDVFRRVIKAAESMC
ncbi:MAG: dipeptidase [Bacteroidales bacterium]|nr:dipeptidase [Bacteroidales bacterium]